MEKSKADSFWTVRRVDRYNKIWYVSDPNDTIIFSRSHIALRTREEAFDLVNKVMIDLGIACYAIKYVEGVGM
jgi:hypothetical protein